MHYVYVIQSQTTGKFYTGQTADLDRRLQQHNDPTDRMTLHTKRNPGPWLLVYHEVCADRRSAMAREKYLKSGIGREYVRSLLTDPGC